MDPDGKLPASHPPKDASELKAPNLPGKALEEWLRRRVPDRRKTFPSAYSNSPHKGTESSQK